MKLTMVINLILSLGTPQILKSAENLVKLKMKIKDKQEFAKKKIEKTYYFLFSLYILLILFTPL